MKSIFSVLFAFVVVVIACSCISCKSSRKSATEPDTVALVGPTFNADSAYAFCAKQCSFGPRLMNTEAHDKCGEWIMKQFAGYGMKVETQDAELKAWDGTMLRSRNIWARFRPEQTTRVLLCAHWDCRPWADNDPDSTNWRKPVMGANDGASGVAVMLELARVISSDSTLNIGVDFVCFDAEDYGVPQWSSAPDSQDSWALGAQYWAEHQPQGYEARYGVLLDMVGGEGARFYQESVSKQYASEIVNKVWHTASQIGYGSYFPMQEGGMITDDHVPVNEKAGIACIDIIPFYPDCQQSSFGPTWHTINDTMEHIGRATLKAVGQTMVQILYSEK
ncbi:M28 family peptidase [uncultured Prevotella sp.]|uniref:M28 family peptidase n=1 Tax=uncultured Prevotella sp. TaxID=159272 RepID=UPI00266FCA89|nr:M28 family peptidase [uncultured Prevotella sp.]